MLDNNATLKRTTSFLNRLGKDRSGNTLALIAAAMVPLLGIVGSGIDMGRAYLASSRLQAACDAGVLAARKELGTQAAVTGSISSSVAEVGQRFFNLNYRSGSYGSENRDFVMTLESDFAISGDAEVQVPTSIMGVFGFDQIPISVDCEALLKVNDLDVMMVLDVTGSMRHSNTEDASSRIESLKSVIRNFHAQLEGAKAPDTAIRYGFVPYATNVNVGHLLEDSWVANDWTYQSRVVDGTDTNTQPQTITTNMQDVSGTAGTWVTESQYEATYTPPSSGSSSSSTSTSSSTSSSSSSSSSSSGGGDNGPIDSSSTSSSSSSSSSSGGSTGTYSCSNPTPPGDYSVQTELIGTVTTVDENGNDVVTKTYEQVIDGTLYSTSRSGSTCTVQSLTYDNYTRTYDRVTSQNQTEINRYIYRPVAMDVSNWRTDFEGCIEERATTEIADYANVDLNQNLDLNLDEIPTPGNANTQWRPYNPAAIYARSFYSNGSGSFTKDPVTTTDTFAATGSWWFSDCPAKAQKLTEMDEDDVNTYLGTLEPFGATYHDIGMIWGGRLISPTGLYASENADTGASERARHLIFLTDGQTEPYDMAYGAYGIEGLDERRWNPSSALSLAQTVEARFGVACTEVKKRNVTVWVIAFGTFLNQAMLDCAGNGQYFEASNAGQLNDAFTAIAKSIGDLRISE